MFNWILSSLLLFSVSEKIPTAGLERQVHERINAERAKAKIRSLSLDEELSAVARAHSRDMAARGFFAHLNPDGKSVNERGVEAGVKCRVVQGGYLRIGFGENIYGTQAYRPVLHRPGPLPYYEMKTAEEVAVAAVQGWMESPGHRTNILRNAFQKTGIGVAIADDDRVLITQMFC